MEYKVTRPKPHEAQKIVIADALRFNVLDMGRRWGKSTLAEYISIGYIVKGQHVGCFFPTFEFGEDLWEAIKERCESIIVYKSESKHLIRFNTGATFKIWSLEKARAGRGKKYHCIIVDEAAYAKDLKESWTKALRPTLTDYKGSAWFLSTPNGKKNYFYDLSLMPEKHTTWKFFKMPSRTNPMLSEEELLEIRNELDELTWLQEFEAEFVDFTGRPFAYSFDAKKHVAKLGKPKISLPLDISFDFNVDPITCIIAQHELDKSQIRIYKEFRLKNSDIYELCDAIIAEYGDDYYFRVTGDASGNNRSAMVSDNLNYYKIIIKRLKIQVNQVFVHGANPRHKNSRVLVNSIMKRHPDFLIDEGCNYLIADNKYCETDDNGEINKNKDAHQTHLLDCERYYLNTWHSDFLKKYNQDSD